MCRFQMRRKPTCYAGRITAEVSDYDSGGTRLGNV